MAAFYGYGSAHTEVVLVDGPLKLVREPYNLSLSLADDLLRIHSKPKGWLGFSGPSKQVLSSLAADAINAASTKAVVP